MQAHTLYLSRLPVLRGHPVISHRQGCASTVSPSDSPVAKVMWPGRLPDTHRQCQRSTATASGLLATLAIAHTQHTQIERDTLIHANRVRLPVP